jgi:predicted nucleotidyltransferase
MDFGISQRSLELLRLALRRFPEIKNLRVFGSRAMGNYKNGSDIDLAIMDPVDGETAQRFSTLVNEELPIPYRVDIVVYDRLENQALKDHIREKGLPFEL